MNPVGSPMVMFVSGDCQTVDAERNCMPQKLATPTLFPYAKSIVTDTPLNDALLGSRYESFFPAGLKIINKT